MLLIWLRAHPSLDCRGRRGLARRLRHDRSLTCLGRSPAFDKHVDGSRWLVAERTANQLDGCWFVVLRQTASQIARGNQQK